MAGRNPQALTSLFDHAMENSALAMDEQELSRRALRGLDLLVQVCHLAFRDGVVSDREQTDIATCVVGVTNDVRNQLNLDTRDIELGRLIGADAEAMVTRRA